jgi:2-succinyl-5-enolpyruvyl-6-hydroxy-3-cyclohexene-1-carboxylate synthase
VIDPANRNTAQASALCEELARCGVRHAVLSPGSRSTPVALALDREPGIELHVVLDERCAGFIALGLATATDTPVAVACTSGSAAANLHPAVVEADLAGVPLVVLTSDRPPELRDIGAGQTIDQIKLYGSSVRWFCEAGSHDADDAGLLHFRSIACRAAGEATRGRGPVHVNLAWRDPLGPEEVSGDVTASDPLALEGRDRDRPLTASLAARGPSDELVAAFAEAIGRAERPLMVAGRDPRTGVAAAAVRLADSVGMPVLAEPTSGLRVGPVLAATTVGAYDAIVREPPQGLAPDLVVRVGDMPTSKPLRAWLSGPGAPDQLVVAAPGRWNDPTRRAGAVIDGDPVAVLEGIARTIGEGAAPEGWPDAWAEAEKAAQGAIEELAGAESPLSEPALARACGAALGDGEQALLASSMPIRDAESFFGVRTAEAGVYANRGANGIDGLISTACGLAAGAGRPTWALLGDLATAYDMGGLANVAALPEGAPLLLVVADNGGGRIFDFLPQAGQVADDRFERLFRTPASLDFERLAGLFGLSYVALGHQRELAEVDRTRSSLIHVDLRDASAGNVDLHREVAGAVASAVANALG